MLMDEKLISTLGKILRLCNQNAEFDKELRKRLDMASSANALSLDVERMDQIYEYCIEKVVRKQAQEFYSAFPISSIRDILVEDFCRMETFRRKDNFGDFCLSLYQQIECMTNSICSNSDLSVIAERMWEHPAYVKTGKGITPTLEVRSEGHYTVAKFVSPWTKEKTSMPNAAAKSRSALQSLCAKDKMRSLFLGI